MRCSSWEEQKQDLWTGVVVVVGYIMMTMMSIYIPFHFHFIIVLDAAAFLPPSPSSFLRRCITCWPNELLVTRNGALLLALLGTNKKWIVSHFNGSTLTIEKAGRLNMGAYLCIATNGIPPTISKRIMLIVHCTYTYPLLPSSSSLLISSSGTLSITGNLWCCRGREWVVH